MTISPVPTTCTCILCDETAQARVDASAALVDCPNCGAYAATDSFCDEYRTCLSEEVRERFRDYMTSSRLESAKLLSARTVCDLVGRFDAYPARWTIAAINARFATVAVLA